MRGVVRFSLFALVLHTSTVTAYHTSAKTAFPNVKNQNVLEKETEFWTSAAQEAIYKRINEPINNNKAAKNVIMFLGDGMSVPTLAAARALLGQREGHTGEEANLSFEKFPAVGLVKTYCVDHQVADSACSATAYLCGIKSNYGTIGVNGGVTREDCAAAQDQASHVSSIAAWAIDSGRDAGVVTTTRITHASPSAAYAHSADRYWESDSDVIHAEADPLLCRDIAYQLVHDYPGNQLKVIFGGGRANFLPQGTNGSRYDNRNLIEEWQDNKQNSGKSYTYVSNREELMSADLDNSEYVMGLFADSHLPYHLLSDETNDPTLEELTEIAIRKLSQNSNGYFLFVEGGRIDHAHHDNLVHLALDETIEFSKAVARARSLTSEEDTLIVVTADHSHVMAYNGYSPRGYDILGANGMPYEHDVAFMTLSYTNGPGFRPHASHGVRTDVTQEENFGALDWPSHVDVYLSWETHAGDDVAVFALGPQQHMFTGLYEQNEIPHLMAYAACLGDGQHAPACSSAVGYNASFILCLIALMSITIVNIVS